MITPEQRKINKAKKDIKKMMEKEGGSAFFDQWLNQPAPGLDHKTPLQLINDGNHQKIIDRLNKIFNNDLVARHNKTAESAKVLKLKNANAKETNGKVKG